VGSLRRGSFVHVGHGRLGTATIRRAGTMWWSSATRSGSRSSAPTQRSSDVDARTNDGVLSVSGMSVSTVGVRAWR
jgi:hypothetical protein